MSEATSETDDSPTDSGDDNIEEPAAMKLEPAETDHIELSQDDGETFQHRADDETDR